jgi:23S rRNA (adenine2030-N6)-methyltransferase
VNYRHAYHAGNFADVVKHVALVALIAHLKKKDTPFRVIDTHAGAGVYDLSADAAARTGEAEAGIARLQALEGAAGIPAALDLYFACVRAAGEGRYPGSPLIAAHLLRSQDRLTAIEKHAEDAAALAAALAPYRNAKATQADGYARLPALLPPPERRGLILIDPPYEADDEFARAAAAVAGGLKRFATGIYLVWFPVKSKSAADAFCGEVMAGVAGEALRIEIDTGTPPAGDKQRLSAAGLLAINPPYGFAAEMRAALDALSSHLGRVSGVPAKVSLSRLGVAS